MAIRVEFFGIPRRRTGTAYVDIPLPQRPDPDIDISLAQLLDEVANRFPRLGADYTGHDWIQAGYSINIDGERFVTDPTFRVQSGQCVLIMSADAGG